MLQLKLISHNSGSGSNNTATATTTTTGNNYSNLLFQFTSMLIDELTECLMTTNKISSTAQKLHTHKKTRNQKEEQKTVNNTIQLTSKQSVIKENNSV